MAKASTKGFTFTEAELTVLKNFAAVSPSMIIEPTGIGVINQAKSVVAKYTFDKPYEFEAFGIYEVPELLSILSVLKAPAINATEKLLEIYDGDSKTRYFTTAKDLLPKVPSVENNFAKVEPELDFDLPGEKLTYLFKMASVIKAQFLFFQTDGKKIRLTVGNELEASTNTYDITIDTGIRKNELEAVLRIPLSDMKLLPGGYDVKLSSKGISRWTADLGCTYFIGVKAQV